MNSPAPVPITVAILTYNEARNLSQCLATVAFAKDVMVVDGNSTDATVDIARAHNARVELSDRLGPKNPGGFAAQRNFAMEKAECDWVFFLDADERMPEDLQQELRLLMSGSGPPGDVGAYRLRRIEHFWGVRTDHTHGAGWQNRLLRRSVCKWDDRRVHEGIQCDGRVGSLAKRILHFSKDSISDYVATMNRYTTLEAEQAAAENRPLAARPWKKMARNFVEVYCYKRAYREGAFGFGMAILFAFYAFLTWAKQWEMQMKASAIAPSEPAAPLEYQAAAALARLWRLKSPPNQDFDSPDAKD